ncbi:MAG TPA: slipin family protein [Armatimonadota bacterium]|jgi:regulator of protease activity HflC (stomatin/prohibitin superfamily)
MSFERPTSAIPFKSFAVPVGQHVSLGAPLRSLLFIIIAGAAVWILLGTYGTQSSLGIVLSVLAIIIVWILVSGLRVAAQWERAIVLRLGRFRNIRGPGMIYIVPFIDYVRFVDMRTLVFNIPSQRVITKDNVPALIDGVIFFLVTDVERAVLKIQDFQFAISQYAQAALRDVIGGLSLDELLTEREQIQQRIGVIVEEHIKAWGLHVDSIRLLDIVLPEDLQRMMSRQASAEREKRANITKAEGDKLAAVNLAEAARIMQTNPGAMQLRALQTIDGLGPSASNTVVLFPVEWLYILRGIPGVTANIPPLPPPATPGPTSEEAGEEEG